MGKGNGCAATKPLSQSALRAGEPQASLFMGASQFPLNHFLPGQPSLERVRAGAPKAFVPSALLNNSLLNY